MRIYKCNKNQRERRDSDLIGKLKIYKAVNDVSFKSILEGKINRATLIAFYRPSDNPFSFGAGYVFAFQSDSLDYRTRFTLVGVSGDGLYFETKYFSIE